MKMLLTVLVSREIVWFEGTCGLLFFVVLKTEIYFNKKSDKCESERGASVSSLHWLRSQWHRQSEQGANKYKKLGAADQTTKACVEARLWQKKSKITLSFKRREN